MPVAMVEFGDQVLILNEDEADLLVRLVIFSDSVPFVEPRSDGGYLCMLLPRRLWRPPAGEVGGADAMGGGMQA